MVEESRSRVRYDEAFWRAHHEAWRRSELNQREYCEAQGIPLKAFGNWRAKFKAEPRLPERKLLYRRGGPSHSLSHTLSHSLSHMTSDPLSRPIVPPAREGHRAGIQRRGQAPDRGGGGAAGCEPVGGGPALRDSGAGSVSLEAGTGNPAGVRRGTDHRCSSTARCGARR